MRISSLIISIMIWIAGITLMRKTKGEEGETMMWAGWLGILITIQ